MRIATATLLALLLSGSGLALSQTTGATPGSSATMPGGNAPAGRTASTTAALPAGGFATEAEAKGHCPTDTIVWANTSSKAYHMSGTKYYGKTKHGAYMCQKDADQGGYHGLKAGSAQAKKKTSS